MPFAARIAAGGLVFLFTFVSGGSACTLKRGETVAVAQIVDGGELRLADGRAVKLQGIEMPHPAGPTTPAWPLAEEARAFLSALAAREGLSLKTGKPKTDRYGRALTFLILADGDSIQRRLVEAGLARVRSTRDARSCIRDLLAVESAARAARRGIWAEPFYAVRHAQDVAALEDLEGSFQIVEGRVRDVSTVSGRVYLNFGDDWRKDFTVTVGRSDVKLFKPGGDGVGDLAALKGRDVRVRGFVERFNGPKMTVTFPEEIELLGPETAKANGKARVR